MNENNNGGSKPQRTLIAYCALAERLNRPQANMFQALVPFFAEACQDFAGEMFDANKFSDAVRKNYGIEIPKLAALGIAEQLAAEGILEVVSGYINSTTYRYCDMVRTIGKDTSPITENDVKKILELFTEYCLFNADFSSAQIDSLNSDFLERLLNIDSMRLLARREASITTKRSAETLQLTKPNSQNSEIIRHSLQLDFLVSSFLIHLRETDSTTFETVSNIAFASMAAEAIACFREPQQDPGDLSELTVLLDTPLILDMLAVNSEYSEYGKDLLKMLKESGCNIAVLDHSIAEAENTVRAKLGYLRSGINQLTSTISVSANLLSALSGNITERVDTRLGISVKKDPVIDLHRKSPNTVGDIEADINQRMAAWRNEDAKEHDRKSVWALISLRDSTTLQFRICKSKWILLTRNTPLLRISNDSWKTWLKGSTNHSNANIDRCAPVSMTDKQFAGYVWARTGGGPSTIPDSLLLAHCSAAVRPRADIKAKAYNLMLEIYGQEEAQDLVALFEDREGGRALMKATLGDPEDVTPQRISMIIERVKLAAGEFAASRVRQEAEQALTEVAKKNQETISKIQSEASLEAERIQKEKEIEKATYAQEIFKEQQLVANLEEEKRNLEADLKRKEAEELSRRNSTLQKGIEAGSREYWAFRWLVVLIFALCTGIISTNIAELPPTITLISTILLSALGYWFVPEFLEPFARSLADKRFNFIINQIDSRIERTNIKKDYKNKHWSVDA